MLFILENWSTHLSGLNDCKTLSGSCILAAQLEDQFGKELAHQWSLASEDSDTPPTTEQILVFVKSRLNTALKKLNNSTSQQKHNKSATKPSRAVMKVTTSSPAQTCSVCSFPEHSLSKCSTFLGWDQNKRYKHCKDARKCLNCLSQSHNTKNCHSSFNCRHCGNRHHTLLHRRHTNTTTTVSTSGSESAISIVAVTQISNSIPKNTKNPHIFVPRHSFLTTAIHSDSQETVIE